MDYNFDEIIDRQNTDSIKYDLRRAIFGREDVLPMWVADMDFKTPGFIIDAIKKRLDHEVLGYPLKPSGLDDVVVDWIQRKHAWSIKKNWIILSPGVVPSMSIIIYAFSNPGDEIIVQQPVYFPFFRTIKNNDRKLINNPLLLKDGKYVMDLNDLRKKITPRTKMIFLCSPHNPGGRVWNKKELQDLAEICLENEILIVSDEIHSDLILFGNSHIPTASINKDIARNTTFNTAGLTTSYVIVSNPKNRKIYKEKLDDFHLNIGNISGLEALKAAYSKGEDWLNQLLKYIEKNILYLDDYIQKNIPSIKVIKPEGTYLVWLDFRDTGLDGKTLNRFLIHDAGLGLSDGALFGEEGIGFQRLNVACPKSVLIKALDNLSKVCHKFQNDETK
jgi:cystathionine beta-lyase